ncbi:hypothetical protein MFLAVUS_010788 [Mucor flavus]|uniref:Uncharacterized protein n=1 Tax=Mucor flavus TaxID=439312 RepID=A0ABP9ZDP0_9FUNG
MRFEEMEVEVVAHEYGNIEKLVEFSSQLPETQVVEMEVVDVCEITAKVEAVSLVVEKKKKKYGQHFFFLMREEGTPVAKAAEKSTSPKFIPEHTTFLIKYFDEQKATTLELARAELIKEFPDLSISLQHYNC